MFPTHFILAATFAATVIVLASIVPVVKAYGPCANTGDTPPTQNHYHQVGPIYYSCNAANSCHWAGFPQTVSGVYTISLDFPLGVRGRVQFKNDGHTNAYCSAYGEKSNTVWYWIAPGPDKQCTMTIPYGENGWTLACVAV